MIDSAPAPANGRVGGGDRSDRLRDGGRYSLEYWNFGLIGGRRRGGLRVRGARRGSEGHEDEVLFLRENGKSARPGGRGAEGVEVLMGNALCNGFGACAQPPTM